MTREDLRQPRQAASSWAERLVLGVALGAAVALCTPLVGVAWQGQSWFALPRALVWVVSWLGVVFLALVVAYWHEGRRTPTGQEPHPGDEGPLS